MKTTAEAIRRRVVRAFLPKILYMLLVEYQQCVQARNIVADSFSLPNPVFISADLLSMIQQSESESNVSDIILLSHKAHIFILFPNLINVVHSGEVHRLSLV